MVVDRILNKRKLNLTDKFEGFFTKDNDTLILLPKTYMNLSGIAVAKMMEGRVAIAVDVSPNVLTLTFMIFEDLSFLCAIIQ